MSFLMIRNPGVAHVNALTVLGVSSSRGDENKLGMFGSGSSHGVLTLLRSHIEPIIFLGNDKLTYFTKAEVVGDDEFQRVGYRLNTKKQMLSYTLDFGALDWNSIHYGLREFISNAIDAVDGDISKVQIEEAEFARAKADHTTVYIPKTPEVLEYYRNLSKFYLHLRGKEKERILIKKNPSPCRVYRKGVFVRELQVQSFCDYNFGGDVAIDEARNMDEHNCRSHARTYFEKYCPPQDFIDIVFSDSDKEVLELNSGWTRFYDMSAERKKEIKNAYDERFGNSVMASESDAAMVNFARSKGIQVNIVKNDQMRSALSEFIPHVSNCADNLVNGCEVVQLRQDTQSRCNKVWAWLEQFGLTADKPMPEIYSFRSIMSGGQQLSGFHLPHSNKVYINEENATASNIIIEEMGHYITNAADGSRDLQDWAFRVAGVILEFHENS